MGKSLNFDENRKSFENAIERPWFGNVFRLRWFIVPYTGIEEKFHSVFCRIRRATLLNSVLKRYDFVLKRERNEKRGFFSRVLKSILSFSRVFGSRIPLPRRVPSKNGRTAVEIFPRDFRDRRTVGRRRWEVFWVYSFRMTTLETTRRGKFNREWPTIISATTTIIIRI